MWFVYVASTLGVLFGLLSIALWRRDRRAQHQTPAKHRQGSQAQHRWDATRRYERTGDPETTQPIPPQRDRRHQ